MPSRDYVGGNRCLHCHAVNKKPVDQHVVGVESSDRLGTDLLDCLHRSRLIGARRTKGVVSDDKPIAKVHCHQHR